MYRRDSSVYSSSSDSMQSGGSGGVSPCACCGGENESSRPRQVGNLVRPCAGSDRIPRQVRAPDNACQDNIKYATRNTQYATPNTISDVQHKTHNLHQTTNNKHAACGELVLIGILHTAT